MIHVISTGRNCAQFCEATILSVMEQDVNWSLSVVVDPSTDDTAEVVGKVLGDHGGDVSLRLPADRRFATRNQWEAIDTADPGPHDIIVILDLDGDVLMPGALRHIAAQYVVNGAEVTYGTHVCVPPAPGNHVAEPFPREVIATNSYRDYIRRNGATFNHPRTMSGRIFRAIPESHFRFAHGPRRGQWYDGGADYAFMVPALELAGPRHRYVAEPLMFYNHMNPEADYLMRSPQSGKCVQDILQHQPVLGPLEAAGPHRNGKVYLPLEDRPAILVDYARKWDLSRLIETGTWKGDTVAALLDDFGQIDTIELDPRLHTKAAHRFRGDRHVNVHHGDSSVLLPKLVAQMDGPALFWLDGHQSGPGTASGPVPIRKELMAALASPHRNVILVDDARCFRGGPSYGEWLHYEDYPSLAWIEAQASVAGYDYDLTDDIIRLTRKD